ncbi:sodium/potassium/calcium exchanger 5-like isoform X3 [Lycorma delicatula]|uniref:sodium/potassium/calcium exchanger 5-like isoform X3 n=1 Tax=Lycorma delicatula TaxID=130591 RepID=UPI003F5199EC
MYLNGRGILLILLAVFATCNCNITDSKEGILDTDESVGKSDSEFPDDIFTHEQRKHGAILFHIFVSLYFFLVIALVCNDYFIPSVICICQDLHLSEDVAGATFMAIATSAPELFVNVIGTFLTETDLGVGTVVGSAVFNTLGVAACGGLAAAKAIPLDVYPLGRDCLIYILVIALLTGILWDDVIYWYEALILIILYVLYFVFMFTENRIISIAKKVFPYTKKSFASVGSDSRELLTDNKSESDIFTGKERDLGYGTYTSRYSIGSETVVTVDAGLQKKDIDKGVTQKQNEDQDDKKNNNNLCSAPKGSISLLWWLFSWPVKLILWMSIPDCKMYRRLYPVTFFMCIVWIGISSYVVSWMMTICGETFGFSDAIMGITLLAIGGSMPEACSSVINAKRGSGSMSISNAIGANTLDILLCLGMPWFIKTVLPHSMRGGPVFIESPSLVYNNAIQIACVIVLFLAASANKYRLNKTLGVICLILYLFFIIFIMLNEMNVFKLNSTARSQ